jgi:two-component SAPR family response regulator
MESHRRAITVGLIITRAQAHLTNGDANLAITLADRGLELDHLDEQLWRSALEAEISPESR